MVRSGLQTGVRVVRGGAPPHPPGPPGGGPVVVRRAPPAWQADRVTDIGIDLAPDPEQDVRARRAALALLAAGQEDDALDEDAVQERTGQALHGLLETVVGPIDVRPESAPALQAMLSTVARQHSAFAAIAQALALEAFAAGQADPDAEGPDLPALLARVGDVVERLHDQGL